MMNKNGHYFTFYYKYMGLIMANENDELKQQDEEEINQDVEELLKEIENTLENLVEEDPQLKKKKPIIKIVNLKPRMFKNIFLEFFYELVISYILIWSINSFFNIIDSNLLGVSLFISIFMIIDYSFNLFLFNKKPILFLMTFGLVSGLISILAFLAGAVISVQIIEMEFLNFGFCLLAMIGFLIIRKVVLGYFLKLKYKLKKGKF